MNQPLPDRLFKAMEGTGIPPGSATRPTGKGREILRTKEKPAACTPQECGDFPQRRFSLHTGKSAQKDNEGRSHAGREAWKRADYGLPRSSPRPLARKLPYDGEIRITTNSFERTSMRLFFTKKELRLRRRRLVAMAACTIVLLAGYIVWTWPRKTEPEAPTVVVTPAKTGDVEIYGEYVGRIRAQQFVEVHARVEGYLEKMLFAEGTYVTKNQVLFVINQAQYKAKADKARAQLKKDEAQALKAQRDLHPTSVNRNLSSGSSVIVLKSQTWQM